MQTPATRRHLITFLGGAKPAGYATACYRFADGQERATPFFGLALFQWLSARSEPPDRLLVLGTPTSMWDALAFFGNADAVWEDLETAVRGAGVGQPQLDALAPAVAALAGRPCDLRLIPFGRDRSEQVELLQILARDIGPGDEVWLDVTHGFRHLPMISLLAAQYLRHTSAVRIRGLFYGAWEMREAGATPVLDLSGLLDIADWISALAAFEASGDYGRLGPLLTRDGCEPAVEKALCEAAYLQQTLQVAEAGSRLKKKVLPTLTTLPAGTPSALFAPTLRRALAWVHGARLDQRQAAAARRALDARRYLQATLLALEALITRAVPTGNTDPADFNARESAKHALNAATAGLPPPLQRAYRQLNQLRNALAHGTRVRSNKSGLQTALSTEATLRTRLDKLLALVEGTN